MLHAVLSHGTNWTTIAASHVPKRTTLALKNRYSTLRLRHENGNKSKEYTAGKTPSASPSSSEGVMATPQKETRTNHNVQGYLSKRADEDDEEIEEDEEEVGEDDEDEDGEEENGDEDDDGNVSRVQFMAHSNKANNGTISSHTIDSNVTTLGSWTGSAKPSGLFSPSCFQYETTPLSTENWTKNDTMDHETYESPFSLNQHSLFVGPGENFFGATQDSGGMRTSAPYTTYGGLALICINPRIHTGLLTWAQVETL